jgi:hypothetical protein
MRAGWLTAILVAGAVGTGVLVAGTTGGGGGGGSTPTVANFWVDGSGTCTRQSTAGAYSNAAACAGMTEAYNAASCGDVILVKSGTYTEENFDHQTDTAACGTRIKIYEETGQTVDISWLELGYRLEENNGADHIEFHNIDVEGASVKSTIGARLSDDVHFYGSSSGGGVMDAITNWEFHDHTFGPCLVAQLNPDCGNNVKIAAASDNVLIEDSTVSGFRCDPARTGAVAGGECHLECMKLDGVTNMTIRRTVFSDCEYFSILFEGGPFDGLLIENSWFGQSFNGSQPTPSRTAPNCIEVKNGDFVNATVRFNACQSGSGFCGACPGGGSTTNFKVYGNIFGRAVCGGATYAYNAYTGASTCSGTGEVALNADPFANGSPDTGFDFHLGSTTSADNLVPTSQTCAPTDIDEAVRPVGVNCDAGADER